MAGQAVRALPRTVAKRLVRGYHCANPRGGPEGVSSHPSRSAPIQSLLRSSLGARVSKKCKAVYIFRVPFKSPVLLPYFLGRNAFSLGYQIFLWWTVPDSNR